MLVAERELSGAANFGEVDVDSNMELAKSVRLLNVSAVGYYRRDQLVALLIGSRQDVRRRLERVMRGESIDDKDGNDQSPD